MGKQLSKMASLISDPIQIQNKTVCISVHMNAVEKSINPFVLIPAKGKYIVIMQ